MNPKIVNTIYKSNAYILVGVCVCVCVRAPLYVYRDEKPEVSSMIVNNDTGSTDG